jgi:hypothetical protein
MIPNNIKKFNDIVPYLKELGFVKYVDTNHMIKYKYDSNIKVIKLNYDLLAGTYADEIMISTIYNRLTDTYENNHKGIFGYDNIINYLNSEFIEFYRRKKIKKLLNDTESYK